MSTTSISSYQAFGLQIDSSITLPGLCPAAQESGNDVSITLGKIPPDLPDITSSGLRFQRNATQLLLNIDGIARYLISEGKEIIIEPTSEADERDILVFLLGSAFGALLQQRKDLVLHASAINWEGQAVIFMGRSGIGKSTLATAFRQQGHPLLTDDLCVIRPDAKGRMFAYPGLSQTKLWLDSLKALNLSADELTPVRHKIKKRILPLGDQFANQPLPIRQIYLLRPQHDSSVEAIPIDGPSKIAALKNNTYRFKFITADQDLIQHFQQILQLAQQVPVSMIVRPHQGFEIAPLVSIISADLHS